MEQLHSAILMKFGTGKHTVASLKLAKFCHYQCTDLEHGPKIINIWNFWYNFVAKG